MLGNGLGRSRDAMAAAERATEYHGDMGFSKWALVELVEAAVHSGMTETAAGALPSAYGDDRAGLHPGGRWGWRRGRARCSATVRRPRAATGRRSTGWAGPGSAGAGPAHLLYGEWLRRDNRRADARAKLRTAYEMLDAMGLAAFAERARRELAATGETVRKRTSETDDHPDRAGGPYRPAGLRRPHQRRDRRPAVPGSVRTVEWHLRKVYTKLDIGSRRELRTALDKLGPDRPAA